MHAHLCHGANVLAGAKVFGGAQADWVPTPSRRVVMGTARDRVVEIAAYQSHASHFKPEWT